MAYWGMGRIFEGKGMCVAHTEGRTWTEEAHQVQLFGDTRCRWDKELHLAMQGMAQKLG